MCDVASEAPTVTALVARLAAMLSWQTLQLFCTTSRYERCYVIAPLVVCGKLDTSTYVSVRGFARRHAEEAGVAWSRLSSAANELYFRSPRGVWLQSITHFMVLMTWIVNAWHSDRPYGVLFGVNAAQWRW